MPKLSVSRTFGESKARSGQWRDYRNRQKSDHEAWSEESDSWNMCEFFFSRLTINNYKGFNPPGTFRESCPPPLKPDLVPSRCPAVSEHSCSQGLRPHCHSCPLCASTLEPAASSLGFFIWSFDCGSSSSTFGEGFLPEGGFPDGAVKKNLPDNAGEERDTGLIPGLGRSPGDRNGYPFQYSCLEHSMDGPWRSLVGYSPWGHKNLDTAWACTFKRREREFFRAPAHTSFSQLKLYPFAFFQTQGPQNCWSLLFRAPSIVRPPQFLH